jgi:hypothetical protein
MSDEPKTGPTTEVPADAEESRPPKFAPHEKVCGNCILWRAHSIDAVRGWVGNCRLQPNRGLFPPAAPLCDKFAPRGEHAHAQAQAAAPSQPRYRPIKSVAPLVRSALGRGVGQTTATSPSADLSASIDLEGASMTRAELMNLFLEASGLADVPLAPRWEGGKITLVPGNDSQSKEIPLDSLFHKIVMIRDRLRTLEQKLNAHPKLSDAEKVDMQQYVTRCYGSLTTFNVLFRDKADQFTGEKGSTEKDA